MNIKTILELQSPRVKLSVEKKSVEGLKCNYCQGNGWFWGRDEHGQDVKDPCPMCGGSGKLKANITIQWTPWK